MTSENHTDIHSHARRRAMIDAPDEEPATGAQAGGSVSQLEEISAAKRRKVRKGTRSCWECKRRKIRCIFASSEDAICIGCQRRHAPCVPQEMPENLSLARKGNRQLGERIARVEDFMKDYLASGGAVGAAGRIEGGPRQDRRSNSEALIACPNESAPSSVRAPLTPAEVRDPPMSIIYIEHCP